jgi:SagB-type dehydrogenase family enzyme
LSKEEKIHELRSYLKDSKRKTFDFSKTLQNQGLPPPPAEKPLKPHQQPIELTSIGKWNIPKKDVEKAIGDRKSIRKYSPKPLTLDELSFLLWATQGVRSGVNKDRVYRVVPSAGCRHALETYLAILNVEGIEPGIYRYLPLTHRIVQEATVSELRKKVVHAALNQHFVGEASAVFIWATLPSRMEWRYGEVSHKVIALDAGHVCQNLYLACEAISAGTCAIAAYDQEEMDKLLELDGEDEFTIYLAPVGKLP